MAAIGRWDIARSLKRLLELTGTYEPAVGEGIVPTIKLFDLENTPFGTTVKWCIQVSMGPVALEYGHIAVVPGASLGENGWISIDEVWLHTNMAAQVITMIPTVDAGVPYLATMTPALSTRSRRQPGFLQGTLWLVPEVQFLTDTNTTATAYGGLVVNAIAGTTYARVDVAIRQGGVFLVSTANVNEILSATFLGRVHMTTAK